MTIIESTVNPTLDYPHQRCNFNRGYAKLQLDWGACEDSPETLAPALKSIRFKPVPNVDDAPAPHYLEGSLTELYAFWHLLANTVDPRMDPANYYPGGDDSFFDYIPSAFDILRDMANDLDTLLAVSPNPPRYKLMDRYNELLKLSADIGYDPTDPDNSTCLNT